MNDDQSARKVDWKPGCTLSTARRRAAMLASAREFFRVRDVLEVEVPSLSSCTVSDPNIESIRATLRQDPGKLAYLQTSPEYFMKRLLCSGFPDIYSIGKVFRDGESGRRHQPEFTMVEWYRLGFELPEIIEDCCAFIVQLLDNGDLKSGPDYLDFADAMMRFAGIDPFLAGPAALADACDADTRLRRVLGDDRDAWLDLLLTLKVIPSLATDRLTVIRHYPASQAALARRCPAKASLADRFEVFRGDLELANGYVELRNAGELQERWQRDLERRKEKGKDAVPLDNRLLDAQRHGLPACAGVAVGFDRLVMLRENADDIAQVQTFGFEDSMK